MLGKNTEDVLNKPASNILSDELREHISQVFITGKRFITQELPVSLNQNNVMENFYMKFFYEPMLDTSGTNIRVMLIAHDIRDQVLARKKLESESLMHYDMLMSAPGFVCVLRGPAYLYEVINEQ